MEVSEQDAKKILRDRQVEVFDDPDGSYIKIAQKLGYLPSSEETQITPIPEDE